MKYIKKVVKKLIYDVCEVIKNYEWMKYCYLIYMIYSIFSVFDWIWIFKLNIL